MSGILLEELRIKNYIGSPLYSVVVTFGNFLPDKWN